LHYFYNETYHLSFVQSVFLGTDITFETKFYINMYLSGVTKPSIDVPRVTRNNLTGSPPKLREYGIHPNIIEKLKLKNFMKDMENVSNNKSNVINEPSS